ncbi:MAG: PKD domain-containing protein [Bacteroidales bacterium]|nr:PKD domain-containing protein [Bacteroidales bacterium]
MIVEIESANDDPVDLLIVEGGSGATISEENFSVPGKISRTLTWAGTPPEDVILNVLWSKVSFGGNWQLNQANITVPFAAVCEIVEPKPYLALDVQDNFENDGYATVSGWKFQDADTPTDLTITQDPVNASNNVADYNRSGNFLYTNAKVELDHRMDLTARRKFSMKVYFPSSNNYQGDLTPTAAIKLQNSLLGANAWTTQTEIIQPVTLFDQWVTLTFNFIEAKDIEDYDQIVIQLGGEGHNIPAQFYFDDFRLLGPITGIEANFSAEPLSGYSPLTVQFTDLSTGSPTGWRWDFNGDGVIDSQLKNPTYTYESPGNYTVYLKAQTTFLSDQITKYHYISVSELVLPDYIYIDFDDNVNVEFSGWPNDPAAVANPDISGINTSPTVGSWERSGEAFANIYTLLDATVNFSNSSIFLLKVHAPVACEVLLKLENSTNPALFQERTASVTTPDVWQQLIFDFAGAESDLYDRIIVFFDFGSNTNNTFFFDELMGPPPTGIALYKPLLALDVQDNFEDDGYATISEWFFQDPGLMPLVVVADPVNAGNNVAEYDRSGTFQYTNAQFILEHRMDLTERNKFEMKVYFPSSNNYTGALLPKIELKLQNSLLGALAYTTQSVFYHEVNDFDQWLTLVFDFSFVADSVNYDQVVVQFGGEGHLEPGLFYFDDINLLDVPVEQAIQLNAGWSGISSYVIPANPALEDLLAPFEDELIILVGQNGFYYPEIGTNTLINWEPQNGYAVKMNAPAQITFSGAEMAGSTISVPSGWSYLPVLSACEVSVQDLTDAHSEIIMIKEIAGYNLAWPENGITTLGQLVPGKAYYIYSTAGFTLTFPVCAP